MESEDEIKFKKKIARLKRRRRIENKALKKILLSLNNEIKETKNESIDKTIRTNQDSTN